MKPNRNITTLLIAKARVHEQAQIHDRLVVGEFTRSSQTDQRDAERRRRRATQMKVRLEAVLALELVEHDLQAAEADGDQSEADIVDAQPCAAGRSARSRRMISVSLTNHPVSASDSIPTGRLIKKTQCHE